MCGCEWDPERNRPSYRGEDSHAVAVLVVGGKGQWHLCESCADLPKFRRFKRQPLRSRDGEDNGN